MTAAEFLAPKSNYTSPDNYALVAWINDYCIKSPLNNLVMAAFGLTLELQKDPADLDKVKEAMRSVLRPKCDAGDKEACKSIDQLR